MRNMRSAITGSVIFIFLATALAGCTPPEKKPAPPGALRRADAALAARDYDGTIMAADQQLSSRDNTNKSRIQAYYYKARALVARPKPTTAANEADLKEARLLLESALALKPDSQDEPNIRADLANTVYFQDDFVTALSNWSAAYEKTKKPDTRAWILYRIGLSEQRLGRFDQADHTFEKVQRNHPNTEQAKRAKEHQGARSFSVQVGTFNKPEVADKLVKWLEGKGLKPTTKTDMQGRHVVSVADLPTYDAAKGVRAQVTGDYPDALIFP